MEAGYSGISQQLTNSTEEGSCLQAHTAYLDVEPIDHGWLPKIKRGVSLDGQDIAAPSVGI